MGTILRRIASFLRRIWQFALTRQSLNFLFFVIIAAIFWLFTTLNEDYKEELVMPVRLENVPENVVVTTPPPSELRVTVRDKGFQILAYRFQQAFQPIVIDWGANSSSGGHVSLPVSDLQKQITARLAASTQLLSVAPTQLDYYYNYGERKRLPVHLLSSVRTAGEDYAVTMTYKPDSVTIYARRSVLDTMNSVQTSRLILSKLKENTQRVLPLQQIPGVKFVPNKVTVNVDVDRLVEKTVQVPVRFTNFPATKVLRTFPSTVNVTFRVGMKLYRKITADNFAIVVTYEDVLAAKDGHLSLHLKSIPDGVLRPRITPSSIEYIVEEVSSSE
ncbi:MAG: YbbR-like domain-containing protein [Alloprevotella sp.]|nr:YbbR-like domain-containing protein [Alloprevotella sp.]